MLTMTTQLVSTGSCSLGMACVVMRRCRAEGPLAEPGHESRSEDVAKALGLGPWRPLSSQSMMRASMSVFSASTIWRYTAGCQTRMPAMKVKLTHLGSRRAGENHPATQEGPLQVLGSMHAQPHQSYGSPMQLPMTSLLYTCTRRHARILQQRRVIHALMYHVGDLAVLQGSGLACGGAFGVCMQAVVLQGRHVEEDRALTEGTTAATDPMMKKIAPRKNPNAQYLSRKSTRQVLLTRMGNPVRRNCL